MRAASRTILVSNPSHATRFERRFWAEAADEMSRCGWRLVQFAARRVPSLSGAATVTIPTRLIELERRFSGSVDAHPRWLSEGWEALLTEWEHLRWQVPGPDARVGAGLRTLARLVDDVLEAVQPSVVLTVNKIDHGVCLPRLAGKARGIDCRVVERSPFETMWLERDGIFAESGFWADDPVAGVTAATEQAGRAALAGLRRNPYGFRIGEGGRGDIDRLRRRIAGRKVFFLPLDNSLWTGWDQPTHPQGDRDYPIFRDPDAAFARIAEAVQRLGGVLVVKPHPSCLQMVPARFAPEILFFDGDLAAVLSLADVVIAFNTKVAFVAQAHDRPTVTLAPNLAALGGATWHVTGEAGLGDALAAALAQDGFAARQQAAARTAGRLAEGFYCIDPADGASGQPVRAFVERLIGDHPAAGPAPSQEEISARLKPSGLTVTGW